jgi:5-methyltetrahydrofolate--homocysteine methyltransferase
VVSNRFVELLRNLGDNILLADGAMGTMLRQEGLGPGECPEEWNVSQAGKVKGVHKGYLEAGCRLILTNTFGGNRLSLRKFGQEDKVKELNTAGVKLAREALRDYPGAILLGDIGPTGELLAPLGNKSSKEIYEVFREQAEILSESGVDALIVETMSDRGEGETALRAARETGLPVLGSFSFNPGKQGFRTMMGVDICTTIKALEDAGVVALGANCGEVDGKEMVLVIQEMRRLTDKPLLAQPNAGKPALVKGKTIYRQGPEEMAVVARELIGAGANIIGGCCGTTPEHLARVAQVVKCMSR